MRRFSDLLLELFFQCNTWGMEPVNCWLRAWRHESKAVASYDYFCG